MIIYACIHKHSFNVHIFIHQYIYVLVNSFINTFIYALINCYIQTFVNVVDTCAGAGADGVCGKGAGAGGDILDFDGSDGDSLVIMIGSILACGDKVGNVRLHGVDHYIQADVDNIPDGRGAHTTFFHSVFSKSIPDLYWYRFYAGFHTKLFQCLGFNTTLCGNVFVGICETMCPSPNLDPVIYFTASNSCAIITTKKWRHIYKLAPPTAPLPVDENTIKL